jgi:DNA repair protein RadA/Sms
MAKSKLHFLCSACGGVQPKWMGKCPDCGTWDSLQEYREPAPDSRRPDDTPAAESEVVTPGPGEAETAETKRRKTARLPTGIGEFDRILGGGIVPGSVVLVGGEPGIGKSTLLLQAAATLSARGTKVLYATSEESADQTRLRAQRLRLPASKDGGELRVLAEANLERICQNARKHKPDILILDSVQMAYKPDLPAAPGSVTQLRDGAMMLVGLAKTSATAVVLVGHVTKQGVLAGPKLLEHIVDTVVYFEGDRYHAHRVVRCVKNRFGSTHEVGLFRMGGHGLEEVTDPSGLFMEHYGGAAGGGNPPSGSVITATLSGSRVLLVEVQALTASSVIGAARRKVSGVSSDRVAMIIAVLEKRAELRLAADDVFVNIAGGVKIAEPAADLAIALAIASAHSNRPMPAGTLAVGELGLGGEVRIVPQLEQRLREASRLGMSTAIVPPIPRHDIPPLKGMSIHPVRRLGEALGVV